MGKLESTKKIMNILFCVSCVILIIAIVLIIIQIFAIIGNYEFLHEETHILERFFNSHSIKNIAMTVGLTGVLLTWLLQIMGETECSQPLSELYSFVFRNYTWQIAIFIVALILCIGFSSPDSPSFFDLLISAFTFLSVIMGMINMWILCSLFLFSREKRRDIAFCYLEDGLKENVDTAEKIAKKGAYLEQWGKEIPRCLRDNEIDHVQQFFKYVSQEWEDDREFNSEIWCKNCHLIVRNVARATAPHLRETIPIHILSANFSNNQLMFIFSLYTLSLFELFPEEHNEYSSWGNDFYKYIWHYLLEIPLEMANKQTNMEKYNFYVYCSFFSVISVLKKDINIAAIDRLKVAKKSIPYLNSNEADKCSNEADKCLEIMKKIICLISNDEGNDEVWYLIKRFHKFLYAELAVAEKAG